MSQSKTEIYKKLFNERFRPETDKEIVYCSIILQLSETLDLQIRQNNETTKAVKYLAKVVGAMRAGAVEAAEETETETVETASTSGAGPSNPVQDQTPFPSGVPTSAPPGSGQNVTTAPAVEEILTPDASSGPAVNAQPIPAKAQKINTKNGAKAEA